MPVYATLFLIVTLSSIGLPGLNGQQIVLNAAPVPEPATWALMACGVAVLLDRPAERALLSGLRLYDDAQYPEAEKVLSEALHLKLSSPRDRAIAHKTLAFIYCTTERAVECEAAFRSAKQADPQFALSKAEAGHPVWGPVYAKSRH